MAQETAGERAAAEAFASLKFGEGPRIGVLGDSGCGKTELMRRMIDEYLRRSHGVCLVVDDKEARAQYAGQEFEFPSDLESPAGRAKLDSGGRRVLVFRGRRFDREAGEVDPETVAELQWKLAQKRPPFPSLVVYDELDKAANHGQWKRGDGSAVRWAFIKGRSSACASLWGTQETQAVPAEAFNQSSTIMCFRMTGAPLRLLAERGYLEGGAIRKVIPCLPGDDRPPAQRGYFVMLRRGRPWDGRVYRFSSKRIEPRAATGREIVSGAQPEIGARSRGLLTPPKTEK